MSEAIKGECEIWISEYGDLRINIRAPEWILRVATREGQDKVFHHSVVYHDSLNIKDNISTMGLTLLDPPKPSPEIEANLVVPISEGSKLNSSGKADLKNAAQAIEIAINRLLDSNSFDTAFSKVGQPYRDSIRAFLVGIEDSRKKLDEVIEQLCP
jgi:hypothetical protein